MSTDARFVRWKSRDHKANGLAAACRPSLAIGSPSKYRDAKNIRTTVVHRTHTQHASTEVHMRQRSACRQCGLSVVRPWSEIRLSVDSLSDICQFDFSSQSYMNNRQSIDLSYPASLNPYSLPWVVLSQFSATKYFRHTNTHMRTYWTIPRINLMSFDLTSSIIGYRLGGDTTIGNRYHD